MQAKLYDGRVYAFPLSEKDMFELLTSFKGLVLHMSRNMTQDTSNIPVQDLAQEGWLAMWKAAKNWDGTGTLDGWMKRNAQWAMLSVVTRRKQTETPIDSDVESVWETLSQSDDLEAVFASYHAGEVFEALAVLTPTQREFVVRKFWLGQNKAEIRAAMGSSNPYSLWAGKYGARGRLARKLAHLVEA